MLTSTVRVQLYNAVILTVECGAPSIAGCSSGHTVSEMLLFVLHVRLTFIQYINHMLVMVQNEVYPHIFYHHNLAQPNNNELLQRGRYLRV